MFMLYLMLDLRFKNFCLIYFFHHEKGVIIVKEY
jgi:hypothetical protein